MIRIAEQLGRVIICLSLCGSCTTGNNRSESDPRLTSTLQYAENLLMKPTADGVEVTILQAYKGAPRPTRYMLTHTDLNRALTGYDAVIRIPVESVAATATSQVGFIDALGSGQLITGFSNTNLISSQRMRKRIDEGKLTELGMDTNINMEALITLAPDLLLAYSATHDVSRWEQIQNLGIPVVYDASFLETSPLAQAEWLKFFGVLTGQTNQADSLFNGIAQRYKALQLVTSKITHPPAVICGSVYNGTWFMPGGKSWVATYIKHAGGNYLWKDLNHTGTRPLTVESVYERGLAADYWIGATTLSSISQMLSEDSRYLKIRAVEKRNIYSPTKKQNGFGGNDYFEGAVVRPDLVLSDFIRILHPGLLDSRQLHYFIRLN